MVTENTCSSKHVHEVFRIMKIPIQNTANRKFMTIKVTIQKTHHETLKTSIRSFYQHSYWVIWWCMRVDTHTHIYTHVRIQKYIHKKTHTYTYMYKHHNRLTDGNSSIKSVNDKHHYNTTDDSEGSCKILTVCKETKYSCSYMYITLNHSTCYYSSQHQDLIIVVRESIQRSLGMCKMST